MNKKFKKAIIDNDAKSIRVLIHNGADVNENDNKQYSPMHLAVANGNIDIIKILINSGSKLNAQSKYGETALAIAARQGNIDIVEQLVSRGADLDIADNLSQTPLYLAVEESNMDVVKLLLSAGANVNVSNNWQSTALYAAVKNGHKKIVELLLAAGADVNIMAKGNNNTPLHIAVEKNFIEIAKSLIEKGANIYSENISQNTPFSLAAKLDNMQMIYLMSETACTISRKEYLDNKQELNFTISKLFFSKGGVVNVADKVFRPNIFRHLGNSSVS